MIHLGSLPYVRTRAGAKHSRLIQSVSSATAAMRASIQLEYNMFNIFIMLNVDKTPGLSPQLRPESGA